MFGSKKVEELEKKLIDMECRFQAYKLDTTSKLYDVNQFLEYLLAARAKYKVGDVVEHSMIVFSTPFKKISVIKSIGVDPSGIVYHFEGPIDTPTKEKDIIKKCKCSSDLTRVK